MRTTLAKFLRVAPLAALFWMLSAGSAQAQMLSSSMTVQCIGTSCNQLRFVLDVLNVNGQDNQLYQVTIRNNNVAAWQFGTVASVTNGGGTVSGWQWNLVNGSGNLQFTSGSGPYATEPLQIVLNVTHQGSNTPEDDLYPGSGASFAYSAEGCDGTTNCAWFQTSGEVNTVTPEPETLILLTLGLTLLGGMALVRSIT